MSEYNIVQPTTQNLDLAADGLTHSNLVVFPTETVYGLGGNAYDDASVTKIFAYKNRPEFNPLSVCYGSLEQAAEDVVITEEALLISKHFLPGPITLLLKRRPNSRLSWLCSAGLETIGIRIPAHPIAQELLARLPFPLAAPSANQSGKISPTSATNVTVRAAQASTFDEAAPISKKKLAYVSEGSEAENACGATTVTLVVVDGGQCPIGIESTIVDLSGDKPRILRLGAVAEDEISEKCGLHFDKNRHETPSAQLKHYTTSKEIVLNCTSAEKSDALLAFGTPFPNECSHVLNLSKNGDLGEAAGNLFAMIYKMDKTNAARICVMPIPNTGMGIPINDRLNKSANV
ncbi:threonylcarbamoyl-AMP synthase [Alphaproteobacteria bacterium]|nr:threonylcarbamoyl-AMP synthase [Alphaproteobacteria bacterium]